MESLVKKVYQMFEKQKFSSLGLIILPSSFFNVSNDLKVLQILGLFTFGNDINLFNFLERNLFKFSGFFSF